MSTQMLLALLIIPAIMERGSEALVCTTNVDCVNIPTGATGVCANQICACLPYYTITAIGCDLRITAPTLHSNSVQGMARGGDYSFTCIPAVSIAQQNSVTYRLMRNNKEVTSTRDNQTFMLWNVADHDAGTYTCIHSFDNQWSPKSNEMVIRVVDAGWVCSSDQGCPSSQGYRRSCDTTINRCVCEDNYQRKGNECVYREISTNKMGTNFSKWYHLI
ncbi:hypothetical protein RRG08_051908 [Elysia crispata]|uniref:Ig-like domain-containing protein n=1 Tax=Elysia crispata TaxID=231223 RepID=A0AAE0Y1S1_9GAST|nr:hypothetical protein RRG08_051908 [Elysia crispata]